MFALFSQVRPAAMAALFVTWGAFASPVVAQSGSLVQEAAWSDSIANRCVAPATLAAQWTKMSTFLQLHGLEVRCKDAAGAVHAKLVVLDAITASEVLRGPLADGEPVETGGFIPQGSDNSGDVRGAWAPDVVFNRRWLASALKKHHLLHASDNGGLKSIEAKNAVRIALR